MEPKHLPPQMFASGGSIKERNITSESARLALDRYNGNRTRAAASLGMSRVTLWRKMKEWGIEF